MMNVNVMVLGWDRLNDIALLNKSSQRLSYGVSLTIWDHIMLPPSRHK